MKKVLFTIFAVGGLLTHGALQAQEAQEDYVKFGGAVRYNGTYYEKLRIHRP
jgi:hypothetical protein